MRSSEVGVHLSWGLAGLIFCGCAAHQASSSHPGRTVSAGPIESKESSEFDGLQLAEEARVDAEVDESVSSALVRLSEAKEVAREGDPVEARLILQECLNDLERSREEFVRSPRLEDMYHRILKELLALEVREAADPAGLQSAGVELSPLDYIGTIDLQDFKVDAALEAMAAKDLQRRELSFPLEVNDTVLKALRFYQGPGRRIMESGLRRSGKYLPVFLEAFKREGIPEDLVYMAHVESLFRPQAYSRARARGIWQFMSGTARRYGLKVDWWVDERLHLEKSTDAAAKHLKDLHDEFQDWLLVLAAYNAGPGRLRKNIRRHGEMDFWEMAEKRLLPRETRNHVPSILAAILIFRNPEHYGFHVEPEPELLFETIQVEYQVDLKVLAEELDLSVTVLRDLNPTLRRDVTPFGDTGFELKVPPGKGALLESVLADLPPEKRLQWRHHKVRDGETLSGIAAQYRTSVGAIADVNRIRNIHRLRLGQDLIIPVSGGPGKIYAGVAAGVPGADSHIVRRGDSLSRIARRYGVSVNDLADLNNLHPTDTIYPGQELRVKSSEPPGRASRQ